MLLATKFMRPAPDPRAIERERLLARFSGGRQARLITVVAPAGYGKTTLVNQWCDKQAESRTAIAWLSLDANDDDPRRFWEYVTGSLAEKVLGNTEKIRDHLNDLDEVALEGAITGLINEVARNGDRNTVLVLDDYHLITSPEIHRQIAFLVDYMPPTMTLVLVSRTEPPLPLARWRVKGWLDALHASDLAFSQPECARFFSDYMGLSLSDEVIARLWNRTEGWAAAMQLTALSRQENEDHPVEQLMAYRGDHKHISDYVLSEILDKQPEHIRRFLLDTSLCHRISAPLCNAMLERDDSQAILEQLTKANLFIIPLDIEGSWFRYHDLFREALNHRLYAESPARYSGLQAAAIQWLLDQDHFQEAIGQLVEREDWSWLEDVLEHHGNNLIHEGYHVLVNNWLAALPQQIVDNNPRLLMLQIWALFFSNKLNVIDPLLEQLEDLLDKRVADSHKDAEGALALHSEIALIRSYMARTRSDLTSAQNLTRQVLRELDHTNIPLKSVTYYGIGLDSYANGDLPGARAALQSAVDYGKREKKHSTVLSSGGLLAWILFYQGEMDLARETCTATRKWVDSFHKDANQPRLISCWQNSSMAQIYREKNDLTLSESYIRPMLDHMRKGTEPGQHIVIQYTRAHLAFSAGNYDDAIAFLEDAENVLTRRRNAILFEPPCLEALHVRCLIAAGRLRNPEEWIGRLKGGEYRNPINREQSRISLARVYLAQNQPDEAIAVLAPLRLSTEQGHHIKHLIELLAVYACALDAQDNPKDAEVMLRRALDLAARDHYLRLFREEGDALARIYQRMDKGPLPVAFTEALDRLLTVEPVPAASSAPARAAISLPEPLSQREIEVLKLINEGHANKVIAEKLAVAPTTIKAHIRNLYGKLGVSSRTAALAKAREAGILE